IPNPEAKTLIAHNTASFRCGNVGRRLASDFFHTFNFQSNPCSNNQNTKNTIISVLQLNYFIFLPNVIDINN
ncbi:MAG: hypothetical protein WCS55_03615, partial [Sulfuricurvum sp.]|uniref:hypothetical protein n=1 Tax=Sulfuricurvum sp. TaxID=2025608 RepID=UPI0035686AE3